MRSQEVKDGGRDKKTADLLSFEEGGVGGKN